MIAFGVALARLVLACLAIIATVLFGVALVAVCVYVLLWLGVP